MAECLSPIQVKDGNNDYITVPCNKCPVCSGRRVSQWSFRLMQQYKIADTAIFVTLTYDTAKVPLTPNGFMTLEKKHPQLFFKRLRKAQCGNGKSPIKYYICGEYGSKTNRPHYHAIIFNARIELIQDAWDMGYIYYGMNVNEASIGYTLKYMSKPSRIPMHPRDDRQKEFALMSKGIGLNYLTPQMVKWHNQSHEFMHCVLPDGKKIAMPRYYKQKIYDEYTRIMYGKLALQTMQENKAKKLSKFGVSIQEYEERVQQQKHAMYAKQKCKSDERQKIF